MDWRQKEIDEKYEGDVERFEDDFAQAIFEGRLYSVQWEDIARDSTTLTDFKTEGRDLIERRLGYLPHDSVILKYEPFIRALFQMHRQGHIGTLEFDAKVDEHVKLIRNQDMMHNTCLFYDARIYQNYHESFTPYGYIVKDRLTKFLGYEPHLEHSVVAEMWLRDIVARDYMKLPSDPTPVDFKALTLIKYREVLLSQGQEAADNSSLLGDIAYL